MPEIEIQTGVVPFPSDGLPAVLLQLPNGYVVVRPADARDLADQLYVRAGEADARQK